MDYSQPEHKKQMEEDKKMRLAGQHLDTGQESTVSNFLLLKICASINYFQSGDFMSEAKDWAGELISGQTGTGRILVKLSPKSISDGTGTQYWLLNPYNCLKWDNKGYNKPWEICEVPIKWNDFAIYTTAGAFSSLPSTMQ